MILQIIEILIKESSHLFLEKISCTWLLDVHILIVVSISSGNILDVNQSALQLEQSGKMSLGLSAGKEQQNRREWHSRERDMGCYKRSGYAEEKNKSTEMGILERYRKEKWEQYINSYRVCMNRERKCAELE